MTEEDNFKDLCNLTTSLLGLRKGSLANKSRKKELQIPRSIVSVIARMEDDTHQKIIAKVLKRDRSLIYHYEKVHEGHYVTWAKYRNTFNKIYNAYKGISSTKKEFFSLMEFEKHLRKNNVCESIKPQVIIEVRCGKFKKHIKVSYRDFYQQIENVKFALTNYKYTIEIK